MTRSQLIHVFLTSWLGWETWYVLGTKPLAHTKLQVHQKSAEHLIKITYWCEGLKTFPMISFLFYAGSRLLPLHPKNFVAWTQNIKMIAYVPGMETIIDAVELSTVTGQFIQTEEIKVSETNMRFWVKFPQEPQIMTSLIHHFYSHCKAHSFGLVSSGYEYMTTINNKTGQLFH